MNKTQPPSYVSPEVIAARIFVARGHRVIIDSDLAGLYGVETKRLNEQVRRNIERFPEDFVFDLTAEEFAALRSQSATSKRGGRRYLPYVFTEHGALQAASILKSPRAVEVSIYVVRAFVQLRAMLAAHKDLAAKLEGLERKLGSHDQAIAGLIHAVRELMLPAKPMKRPIGFTADLSDEKP